MAKNCDYISIDALTTLFQDHLSRRRLITSILLEAKVRLTFRGIVKSENHYFNAHHKYNLSFDTGEVVN